MTLSYLYNGGAITHDIAPSTASITGAAENGETAQSGLVIEDPDANLELLGHRPFVIEESACSQPRLFTGWTTERAIGRIVEDGLHGDATSRGLDTTIVDVNALFNFRLISGTDGKRPEETWNARMAWLLASDYLTGLIEDTGYIISNTSTMDAADYTDGFPSAVMSDLMDRVGGAYTYFAFWDSDVDAVGLFAGLDTTGILTKSTLSISNVIADIDSDYVFAPDPGARLSVTPTETYSEVVVNYAHGTKRLFRSRAATATRYIRRGTTIERPYTGGQATASKQAEHFLDKHAVEVDRITVTIIVPASRVGLLVAGQLIDVKFSHLTGYTSDTTMRCVRLTVTPTNDLATHYAMAMELLGPAGAALVPVESQMALLYSDHGCTTQDYPRVPMYTHLGDSPPDGWTPYDTIGLVEALTCEDVDASEGYRAIQVNGSGTVSIEHYGAFAGVSEFGDSITWAIRKNGVAIASGSWTDPVAGWGHFASGETYLLVEDEPCADGDVFDTYVNITGDGAWLNVYYRMVGVPWNPSLKLWGDLSADGDTEVVLPPPPGATITSASDPTVNDDAGDAYQVGQVWINTSTGEVFVLVDNTTGAAVWVSTAGGTGTGGTDLGWYNVKTDGTATGDGATDDTVAIQAAITAATASGTQSATLYFPPGTYLIGGALQDTGAFNGQILLPDVSHSQGQITLTFKGAARPPFNCIYGGWPIPDGYSVIKSTLTGASGTAAVFSAGNRAITQPNGNNISVNVEDLLCQGVDNPTFTFWNLISAQGGGFTNVQISTPGGWAGTAVQPTNTNSYGVKLPAKYYSNYTLTEALSVGGYYTCVLDGELAIHKGLILGICIVGLECPETFYPSLVLSMQLTAFQYGIRGTGSHGIDVLSYVAEHATTPAWMVTVEDLDDASDYLFGHIRWYNAATGGAPDHTFNRNGGATVTDAELGPITAGAPATVDYLVGTASGALSSEIVVGTTPGGELGGTWASPTVDATHAGSAHLALGSTSSTAAAGDHTHAGAVGTGELVVVDGTTGPTGVIPSSYVEMTTPDTTTSASLEDITGATTTITLQRPSDIAVWMTTHVSAGATCDLGLAINIDGTDHDATTTHLTATDEGNVVIMHRSVSKFAPGTYTVKGRMNRVSGGGTPSVDRVDLLVSALTTSGPVLVTTDDETDYVYADLA